MARTVAPTSFIPAAHPLRPRFRDAFYGMWLANLFGSIVFVFLAWPALNEIWDNAADGVVVAEARVAEKLLEPTVWTTFVIVLFEIFWAVRLVIVRGSGSFALDLGLKFKLSDFGWGVLGWVAIFVGGTVLERFIVPWLLPAASEPEPYNPLARYVTLPLSLKLLMLLTIGLLVPFAEEMLFRGVLLRVFSRWVGPIAAILCSSAIFGFFHATTLTARDWAYVLWAAWAGIVFGVLRVGTDRLGAGIIAHGMQNSLIVALMVISA